MLIHDPERLARGERVLGAEFTAMHERVLAVTALTSRLNITPFEDEAAKAALFEQILGGPLPAGVTIYPPFYTDHGLNLELAERVFVNQVTGGPIDVAENVWIGAGATILPGVSIGRDAVIAAGAVVADDVPEASLVTGPKGAVHRSW
jgi:acetyltransferase-like isoleucine patch superfamily enzyme